jgi:hypothetical protein
MLQLTVKLAVSAERGMVGVTKEEWSCGLPDKLLWHNVITLRHSYSYRLELSVITLLVKGRHSASTAGLLAVNVRIICRRVPISCFNNMNVLRKEV